MYCDACNLELPNHLLFKCDGHCDAILCKVHLVKHAIQNQMTHRTVPGLLKESVKLSKKEPAQ